jgi:hypothetical protein
MKWAFPLVAVLVASQMTGCFLPHPATMAWLKGARVAELPEGGVRVSLRRRNLSKGGLMWSSIGYSGRIRQLDLSKSTCDDETLQYLAEAMDLQALNLRDTQVSDDAVAQFQAAHPDCIIVR